MDAEPVHGERGVPLAMRLMLPLLKKASRSLWKWLPARHWTPLLAISLLLCYGISAPSSQPSPEHPLQLAVQPRHEPLGEVLLQSLHRARHQIVAYVYRCTSPTITSALLEAMARGVHVELHLDQDEIEECPAPLLSIATGHHSRGGGIYHPKVLLLDEAFCWVGSANYTPGGLNTQANLMLGIYDAEVTKALARLLQGSKESSWRGELDHHLLRIFRLPGSSFYQEIIQALSLAKREIRIAMFVLSHPGLIRALEQAHHRGVTVEILLNGWPSAADARAALRRLHQDGMALRLYPAHETLHAKICWIDRQTLVGGSVNWTRSAFKRNTELGFMLSPLVQRERHLLSTWWQWMWQRSHPPRAKDSPLQRLQLFVESS